jgi:cytochrome c peroxidase
MSLTKSALAACLALLFPATIRGASLHLDVSAIFGAEPLAFDSLRHVTSSGQRLSFTRLDFLLSEIALKKDDETWMGLRDWQAYLSLRNGRDGFTLRGVPEGNYKGLRFLVGLRPEVNASDAAQYPAEHPLNPNVNGLHWGWRTGYVFLALEGNWREESGRISGFSFHLATDKMLMSIELPLTLELKGDQALTVSLDVAKLLGATMLNGDSTSTHSRDDDPIAERLRANATQSFAIAVQRGKAVAAGAPAAASRKVELAPGARLYGLTFPASYPRPALPTDNPLTHEGIELGRRLFEEKRLSINGTQSCASCHQQSAGFTDVEQFSKGAEGTAGTRHTMPLVNLAWKAQYFWDGRAKTLREQVLEPIQNPIEMHETLSSVVGKLSQDAAYPALFEKVFGTPEISADRVARALEQFLITLIPARSKLDLALEGKAQLSAEEQRGFDLFNMEYDPRRGMAGADCFHCHGGALFTNNQFANNGLDESFKDEGRSVVTKNEADRGKFSVPSLRGVAQRTRFMHDGRFSSLEEVVEHYSTGVKRSATLDPNIAKHPDGGVPLSAADKQALVAFLKALSEAKPER